MGEFAGDAVLRSLLQRHIKARVASLRQAYSRRAAMQRRPDQFAVELKLLEHMDQAVPARASPWKLWTTLVTVTILTFGLGAQKSASSLRDQDWRLLDKLRESIVSIGSLSAGNLLPLIEQGSLVLLLTILLFVIVVAIMALRFLRDPFAVKRTLRTGGFRVKTDSPVEGLEAIAGTPFKVRWARRARTGWSVRSSEPSTSTVPTRFRWTSALLSVRSSPISS